jgi:hypothetical protein
MRYLVVLLCAFSLIACDAGDDDDGGNLAGSGAAPDSGSTADTDSTPDGQCPYAANVVTNPEGGYQGDECTTDDDCRYGTCVSSPLVTGDQFKICTKQCNCGENSECSADGRVDGLDSTCLRFGLSVYPDEPMTAFCQRECTTVSDCQSFSEKYTDCRVLVGVTKVCTVAE